MKFTSPSEYFEIAKRLQSFDTREFGDGATEDEVSRAEQTLGVRINGGYRDFLMHFGWGGVEHLELYGLGGDVPSYLNLVAVTQSERNEMQPPLRAHLVPVMNDGGGNLYCLDTSAAGEPTIVFWDHTAGTDQDSETMAADFTSWLNEQLNDLAE